ncbi:Profilin/allergen [Tothia fuscella]|uniref:Profilin n=1 Tax=Tothia fuscella TaxID=1048955 RepID=A0A9P4NK69_9PEZI|nr:Profilin/allergen [Tothia fuscella]
MSWQAYIDSSLVGSGDVDSAAIFSVDGKDSWAHSPDFKIDPAEMKVILDGFTNPDKLWGEGFKVNGVKYTTIKVEDGSIYGKQGKTGMIIVKTVQALLLAHHPDTVVTGNCANTVEKLGEYLRGVGY